MYGILENERLSQRTLIDTFNDPLFKLHFDLDAKETVRRSSISERLSVVDSDYFKRYMKISILSSQSHTLQLK